TRRRTYGTRSDHVTLPCLSAASPRNPSSTKWKNSPCPPPALSVSKDNCRAEQLRNNAVLAGSFVATLPSIPRERSTSLASSRQASTSTRLMPPLPSSSPISSDNPSIVLGSFLTASTGQKNASSFSPSVPLTFICAP